MAGATRTYYAQSIFVSKTFWINLAGIVIAVLQANDVIAVLPPSTLKYTGAVIAVINIVLRFATVRPVALIAPGDSKPVEVPLIPDTTPPSTRRGGGYPGGIAG